MSEQNLRERCVDAEMKLDKMTMLMRAMVAILEKDLAAGRIPQTRRVLIALAHELGVDSATYGAGGD